MISPWFVGLLVGAALLTGLLTLRRPLRAGSRQARFVKTRRDFHAQRERLEAKFVQLASAHARSDPHRWDDCDFDDDVAYVRNRRTGELCAFVAVTVAAEEPNGLPAGNGDVVGNLHAGTAVFRFDRDHWETDGRAILNLSPVEVIRFYERDLEVIDQEFAQRP